MLIGYMRVSTDNDRQLLDLQCDALLGAGSMSGICSRIVPWAAGLIGRVWPDLNSQTRNDTVS